jgi:nucleoside-diphosphate-sugar epimerase
MKQTILGSGGGIGAPLAKELIKYTEDIRLVSRHPKKVNDGDELYQADLNDLSQIDKAISGSEVVYVTVGFDYNIKVWKNTWPPFMKEVIASCIRHNSKLVFFDNIYMYDKKEIPAMTESSAINPPSEKGKVRRDLREMVIRAAEEKKLNALIARSADFYGPANRNSALTLMVAENLLKGKKAQVLGNPDKIHSFTFTPDAAKATAILGNTPDAFNQEWHVMTSSERLTTRQWIELIAKEINTEARIQKVPALMVKLLGLFVPIMREFPEMLYQYEQDYFFDSSKFEKHFGLAATAPAEGVRQLVDSLKTPR